MKEKILLIWKHLKQGTLKKMWKQTLWIYQYGRRYWKAMILYTLLGLVGTGVSLVSSLISRDLVDIITGHQTGKLVSTFAAMIGFSVANILVSQASGYASTFIILRFLYDWDGQALSTEPSDLPQIKNHISQISSTVNKYADCVYILQGTLTGNTGEMNHSNYGDINQIRQIIEALDQNYYISNKNGRFSSLIPEDR